MYITKVEKDSAEPQLKRINLLSVGEKVQQVGDPNFTKIAYQNWSYFRCRRPLLPLRGLNT